ncbi:MAG: PH domain-containing protein, partial [Halobacteriaceae archaeon]
MNKDPTDIIQAASGSIDEQVLCNTSKGNLLSTGYLNDQPVIEYLRDSESLEYLFDNKSNGVIVQRNGSQKTLDASSGYRSVFAVTSERIFFVVGRDAGDTSASIEYQNVENATFESKFLSGTIEVRTKDGRITYRTNRGDDGEGAAEYIRQKASQTSHQESEESPSDQSQANQLLSVDRVQKRETLSEEIARDLAEVRDQFDAVGTTIEDIDDAMSRLTRAHTTLSKVYDQASSEEVNKGEIDSLLEEIEEILGVLDRVAETRGEVLASLPDEVRDWVESDGEQGSAPKASQTEAIEELEEVRESEISKDEVREVFESGEVPEVDSEEETEEEEPETE